VYNVDLLRQLCRDIANEKDPQKEQDLVSVLQAVIKEDQEESESEWPSSPRSMQMRSASRRPQTRGVPPRI